MGSRQMPQMCVAAKSAGGWGGPDLDDVIGAGVSAACESISAAAGGCSSRRRRWLLTGVCGTNAAAAGSGAATAAGYEA